MYKIDDVLSPTIHPLKAVHGWAYNAPTDYIWVLSFAEIELRKGEQATKFYCDVVVVVGEWKLRSDSLHCILNF
jgi:hypothetical protein